MKAARQYIHIVRYLMVLIPLAMSAQRPVPVNNELARVVIATSPPGPKGRLHRHDVNRVMVYLDKGAQRIEYEDGTKRDIPFEPGDVKWDPKGGLHTSENIGGTTFRVVEIELKKDGTPVKRPDTRPFKAAPGVFKVELENEQVRVLRVKLAPGQAVQGYDFVLPRIIVPLTELDLRTRRRGGEPASIKLQPAAALYDASPIDRQENALDRVAEYLIVELKM